MKNSKQKGSSGELIIEGYYSMNKNNYQLNTVDSRFKAHN